MDTYRSNTIISLHFKHGAPVEAKLVFDQLHVRDVVSWNTLIAGCTQHGKQNEALDCFQRMHCEGLLPNAVTISSLLKAAGKTKAINKGKRLHTLIFKQQWIPVQDSFVGAALVDMYVKCEALREARQASDQLEVRSVVSWTALISGYAHHGCGNEAIDCYEQMQWEGFSSNPLTYASILKACSKIGADGKGEAVHAELIRVGLLGEDLFISTGLVDMYAKSGAIVKAREVFDQCIARNEVFWNALITGYSQHGHSEESFECFKRMHSESISSNAVTLATILKSCANIASFHKGTEVHAMILKEGLLKKDVLLGSVLIDMYVKCGALVEAQKAFDLLPSRNVVSWSVLIVAYSQLGQFGILVELFERMIGEGIQPDIIMFNVMLNACSHLGCLDRGEMFFDIMSTWHGIIPTVEHFTCMVNLFGRAGHFEKAISVIQEMLVRDNHRVWTSLMGACKQWGNMKLGEVAYEHAIGLHDEHAATYICMRNICSVTNMREDQVNESGNR